MIAQATIRKIGERSTNPTLAPKISNSRFSDEFSIRRAPASSRTSTSSPADSSESRGISKGYPSNVPCIRYPYKKLEFDSRVSHIPRHAPRLTTEGRPGPCVAFSLPRMAPGPSPHPLLLWRQPISDPRARTPVNLCVFRSTPKNTTRSTTLDSATEPAARFGRHGVPPPNDGIASLAHTCFVFNAAPISSNARSIPAWTASARLWNAGPKGAVTRRRRPIPPIASFRSGPGDPAARRTGPVAG